MLSVGTCGRSGSSGSCGTLLAGALVWDGWLGGNAGGVGCCVNDALESLYEGGLSGMVNGGACPCGGGYIPAEPACG